ncbi:hypothetical protein M0R45_021714 [Rubus argutus]|uniref:Uncharacterized protein n=1 Tax=Rubus argutus TaxID=59490 RepID=A0AAW1XFR2_RUBAR
MVGPSVDPTKLTLKFLCSYGGKILPRYPDGKLRYLGGETRVLAVPRSISFSELLLKLGELCGTTVGLPLPIANRRSRRAHLHQVRRGPRKSHRGIRQSCGGGDAVEDPSLPLTPRQQNFIASFILGLAELCLRQSSQTPSFQRSPATAAKVPHCANYHAHGNPSRLYLVHNGNHWQ